MQKKNLFKDKRLQLWGDAVPVSEADINRAVPEKFLGKDDFVEFYVKRNGGMFKGEAYFYRDTFHRVPRGKVNSMPISCFFPIPLSMKDADNPPVTIASMKAASLKGYGRFREMKEFLKTHIPIADDGGGDSYWIEVPTGRICYIKMEYVGAGPINIIEIAPTFAEFVSNIVGRLRAGDVAEVDRLLASDAGPRGGRSRSKRKR